MHLNGPAIQDVGRVVVGLHGGSASHGARKNEDGALVWVGEPWVLAMVLDAHNSAERHCSQRQASQGARANS